MDFLLSSILHFVNNKQKNQLQASNGPSCCSLNLQYLQQQDDKDSLCNLDEKTSQKTSFIVCFFHQCVYFFANIYHSKICSYTHSHILLHSPPPHYQILLTKYWTTEVDSEKHLLKVTCNGIETGAMSFLTMQPQLCSFDLHYNNHNPKL